MKRQGNHSGGHPGSHWEQPHCIRTDRQIAEELLRRHGWRMSAGNVYNVRQQAEAKLRQLLKGAING